MQVLLLNINNMKLQIIFAGAAIALVAMVVTNPSQDRYIDYAAEEFAKTGQNSICTSNLPTEAKQQCEFAVNLLSSQGKPLIKKYIQGTTQQQNFFLFSLYTTDAPSRKLTTIAALGNFYMIK